MPAANANVSDHSGTISCPLCGEPLPASAIECSKCDWVKGYRHREPVTQGTGRDITAVVLSGVPGLGHVFKGHIGMGVAYLVGTCLILFFVGAVGMVAMGFQLLLLPLYWIWVMAHAFLVPDLNKPEPAK